MGLFFNQRMISPVLGGEVGHKACLVPTGPAISVFGRGTCQKPYLLVLASLATGACLVLLVLLVGACRVLAGRSTRCQFGRGMCQQTLPPSASESGYRSLPSAASPAGWCLSSADRAGYWCQFGRGTCHKPYLLVLASLATGACLVLLALLVGACLVLAGRATGVSLVEGCFNKPYLLVLASLATGACLVLLVLLVGACLVLTEWSTSIIW